jgi:hypothetical protein
MICFKTNYFFLSKFKKAISMKQVFVLLVIAFSVAAYGQDEKDFKWQEPSKESEEYHVYRTEMAWPPYGLSKIMELIEKIKFDVDNETEALDKNIYDGLTLQEKFTYNMIHPESYSQNCDAMPPIQDEDKKIFGYLPDIFGENNWSSRQRKFLKDNRDTVMALIKAAALKSKRVEANYKQAIDEINGTEMIPFLIDMYNRTKKDHDILTLLMLLMEENKYPLFMASISHRKLYGDGGNYQAYLDFNKANEALIIKRATDFYHNLKK